MLLLAVSHSKFQPHLVLNLPLIITLFVLRRSAVAGGVPDAVEEDACGGVARPRLSEQRHHRHHPPARPQASLLPVHALYLFGFNTPRHLRAPVFPAAAARNNSRPTALSSIRRTQAGPHGLDSTNVPCAFLHPLAETLCQGDNCQCRGNFEQFEEMYEQKRTEVNKAAEKYEKQIKAAKRSGNKANQVGNRRISGFVCFKMPCMKVRKAGLRPPSAPATRPARCGWAENMRFCLAN